MRGCMKLKYARYDMGSWLLDNIQRIIANDNETRSVVYGLMQLPDFTSVIDVLNRDRWDGIRLRTELKDRYRSDVRLLRFGLLELHRASE